MAAKVLLGLLVAAGVTGAAVFYAPGSGLAPPATVATAEATCSASDELPACCAASNRAAAVCCEGMEDALSHSDGSTAIAAVAGGACLGR